MLGVKANNILWTELQWAKIKLGNNIAYSHPDWQTKNSANICITYSFVPLFTIFRLNLCHWLKIDLLLMPPRRPVKVDPEIKIKRIKAEFANLRSVPPAHCSQLGQLQHLPLPVLKEESPGIQVKFKRKTNS